MPPLPSGILQPAPLTASQFNTLVDAISSHWDWSAAAMDGGKTKSDAYLSRILATANFATADQLGRPAKRVNTSSKGRDWFRSQYSQTVSTMNAQISQNPIANGVISVDAMATYLNGLTPYSALIPWEFADMYYRIVGKQLTPANVFCPGGPAIAPIPPASNTAGVTAPAAAPTTTPSASGGSIPTGHYEIGYTYVTPDGETTLSPISDANLTGPNASVSIAAIALPAGVTAVKFYMEDADESGVNRLIAVPAMADGLNTDVTVLTTIPLCEYAYHTGAGNVIIARRGWPLDIAKFSGGGALTDTQKNGGKIPDTNNTGVDPVVQGYSPCLLELLVVASITGTGTFSLQFIGKNQVNATQTWNGVSGGINLCAAGVGLAAGTVIAINPATGGDRFRSLTSVSQTGSGGPTGGQVQLRVKQERIVL